MSNVKKIAIGIAGLFIFIMGTYSVAQNKEAYAHHHHRKLTTSQTLTFAFLLTIAIALATLLVRMDFNASHIQKSSKKEDKSLRTSEYKTENDKLNVNCSEQNSCFTFSPIVKQEDQELSIDDRPENAHSEKSLTIEMPKFDIDINEPNNLMKEMNVLFADSNSHQETAIHHV